MVIFTSSNVAGYGAEQDFDPANMILDWIRTSWTLADPAPHHPVNNPYGILFGLDYVGYHDFVAYASNRGHAPALMSVGGRMEWEVVDVAFIFNIRRYNVTAGDQIPEEVNVVIQYLEDKIDRNPRALRSQGIPYMQLITYSTGEREVYNQQCWELEVIIRCYYARINI